MAVLQGGCALMILAFIFHGAISQDDGRNDGPILTPIGLVQDSDSFMELRDGGRNDGEPDYNPELLRSFSEDLDGKT